MGCFPGKNQANKRSSIKRRETPVTITTNREEIKIDAGLFVGKRKGNIKDHYSFGTRLGSGAYGYVRTAIHKTSGHKRAVKTISKENISKDMLERSNFFNEVDILSKADHPNIVKLYEFYEEENFYHLVTEFITGGELFDFIVKSKNLTEPIAAHFMKQILSGIAYCHSKNIVHRDIKPENLLLDKDSPDAILKIIDFGTSKIFDKDVKLTQKYGTAYYIAPEVLRREYTEKCDIWSCGVILYILLSGRPPFSGKNDSEILKRVQKGFFSMKGADWEKVSVPAKNLIKKMLNLNPNARISAEEALADEWILHNSASSFKISQISTHTLNNLKAFHVQNHMQSAVLSFISSQLLAKDELKKLAENFKRIDKNGDGKLSREELIEVYAQHMGNIAAGEEVEKIMNVVDINNSGFIDYSEFLMASSEIENLLRKNNLNAAFEIFDVDGNGKISADELKAFLGNGEYFKEDLYEKLIEDVDLNGDGEIDINEFKTMMVKLLNE